MALMFMGINKIAYDLLLENPMTGYMNEVIFSRILGNEDIDRGYLWKDCSQCYVCEKWDKTTIQFSETDNKVMKRNVGKLDELHQVLQQCVDLSKEKLIKKVPESEVKKMYEEDERPAGFGAELLPDGAIDEDAAGEDVSEETASEDRI